MVADAVREAGEESGIVIGGPCIPFDMSGPLPDFRPEVERDEAGTCRIIGWSPLGADSLPGGVYDETGTCTPRQLDVQPIPQDCRS